MNRVKKKGNGVLSDMDNLRSVLSITLSKIPPSRILSNEIVCDNITKDVFVNLAGYYVKNYSNDELEKMFYYILNEYEQEVEQARGEFIRPYEKEIEYMGKDDTDTYSKTGFSVFDAISIFAVRILQELDGEPVCKYEHMLRWRMTSHELDEDVFTTAFMAFKDGRYINMKRNFSWRPVIRHNNIYLNKLLSQGMADNHFHLKGSAPQFPLSWISMMNNVVKKRFRNILESYSEKPLSVVYYTGAKEEHLYILYLKAALIRCYLFSKLVDMEFVLLPDRKQYLGKPRKEREKTTDLNVESLLYKMDEILFFRNELQENIESFRKLNTKKIKRLDYALSGQYDHVYEKNEENYILSGERWLMYSMFQKIYSKDVKFKKYFNMFYAYLVIKERIRSELVQTNDNMGFDNFARYQDRKEDFIEDTDFEEYYIKMALKGTIKNQNIVSLEARITPRNTAEGNRDYIKKFEHFLKFEEQLKDVFFYVFHFVKEGENRSLLKSNIMCRHYQKRKKLHVQACAIARFREKYPHEAKRLKGIDACAKEIGCRPEVFSQTYRYLRNHIVYRADSKYWTPNGEERYEKINQLSMTYHIGEDYLDIIDGLRAIDEAVCFLRLNCGARMGHALALGVNVEEYYAIKKYKILISQQDYLDNLVWVYYKIKDFGLKGYEDLLLFIEQEYNKYFRTIYGNFVCDFYFESVINTAREFFEKESERVVEGYCNSHFYFRISEYYSAWKLRGDNPECYINGYFKELDDISEWNRFSVNREYPRDYRIRYNPECAYLYHLYHYCGKAKEEGEKVIEVHVKHQLVQCVKEIQTEMKKWIAKLGIGIEINPSSNYLIGPFSRYDKHPVFEFYNLGLTTSWKELEECPQIPVCVNTDDQGIFATYLENEYALLALALEKTKDEKGENKYNRMLIYQWIDNVRKLGVNLSFNDFEEDYSLQLAADKSGGAGKESTLTYL